MPAYSRTTVAALVVAASAVAFAAGQMLGVHSASAAAGAHAYTYTLRIGDKAIIPSVGQVCTVETEAGLPELFCSRTKGAHHQVVFLKSSILVYKIGDPDNPPVWTGRP